MKSISKCFIKFLSSYVTRNFKFQSHQNKQPLLPFGYSIFCYLSDPETMDQWFSKCFFFIKLAQIVIKLGYKTLSLITIRKFSSQFKRFCSLTRIIRKKVARLTIFRDNLVQTVHGLNLVTVVQVPGILKKKKLHSHSDVFLHVMNLFIYIASLIFFTLMIT